MTSSEKIDIIYDIIADPARTEIFCDGLMISASFSADISCSLPYSWYSAVYDVESQYSVGQSRSSFDPRTRCLRVLLAQMSFKGA